MVINQLPGPFLDKRSFHFLAMYECGNIHRAADQLNLTQPALTKSLKQLEETLKVQLFTRSKQGLEPTEAGKIFYRYACSVRQSATYAMGEIEEHAEGGNQKLRIGAGVGWSMTVIPSVLADLRANFSSLSLELITGVADQLAEIFQSGKVDVLLVSGAMDLLDSKDFEQVFLKNVPMVAVTNSSSPIADLATVTPSDLSRLPWAGFYEDESFRHHAGHFMGGKGLPAPKIVLRTNSFSALMEFVRSDSIVTVLTEPLAEKATGQGLKILNLSEPLWDIPVNIFFRRTASRIRSVQLFAHSVATAMR